jgi:hypothetical protein
MTKQPTGKPGEWFWCLKHAAVEEGPECNEEWDNDPRWQ